MKRKRMSEKVEFVQVEQAGHTDVVRIEPKQSRITDFCIELIELFDEIYIYDSRIPIYIIDNNRYLLIRDLYQFEKIGRSAASTRLDNMRENNELIYPLKNMSYKQFQLSFSGSIKLNHSKGFKEVNLIRVEDGITYLSHAKKTNKYQIIKTLVQKIIWYVNDREKIKRFLWRELELFDREIYHKIRKHEYGDKVWNSNTWRRMRRIRYLYDRLSGEKLPGISKLALNHHVKAYTDEVFKKMATQNIRWMLKVKHKKGANK